MKKKLKFILPLLVLVIAGGAYKTVLAKPAPAPKPKVDGTVYVLGQSFLINLQDGRFAKVTAALVLPPGALPAAKEGTAAKLDEEPVVRSIITADVTNAKDATLIVARRREALEKRILKDIRAKTDVKVTDVLFTDVTVQ